MTDVWPPTSDRPIEISVRYVTENHNHEVDVREVRFERDGSSLLIHPTDADQEWRFVPDEEGRPAGGRFLIKGIGTTVLVTDDQTLMFHGGEPPYPKGDILTMRSPDLINEVREAWKNFQPRDLK